VLLLVEKRARLSGKDRVCSVQREGVERRNTLLFVCHQGGNLGIAVRGGGGERPCVCAVRKEERSESEKKGGGKHGYFFGERCSWKGSRFFFACFRGAHPGLSCLEHRIIRARRKGKEKGCALIPSRSETR